MMSNHAERARRYHQAIKRALLKEWDPIGVGDIPEAHDEYDSYVGTIYKLLISNQSKQEIADYLCWLETEHMGLSGDRQAAEKFAERLSRLPQELDATF
jgi:hypothetical protein